MLDFPHVATQPKISDSQSHPITSWSQHPKKVTKISNPKQTPIQPPSQKSASCWWPQRVLRSCSLCWGPMHPLKKGNNPFLNFSALDLTHSYTTMHLSAAPSSSFLTSSLLRACSRIKIHSPAIAEAGLICCSGREALAQHQLSSLSQTMSFPFWSRARWCFHHYQHRQHTMQHKYSHGLQSIFLLPCLLEFRDGQQLLNTSM